MPNDVETLAQSLANSLLKYSATQPRDDHGRWSQGGSAASDRDLGTQAAEGVRQGGFSLHPYRGGAPKTGYQVALKGMTQQFPMQRVTKTALVKAIREFRHTHRDLMTPGGRFYIGGWVHEGTLFLEPSERVSRRADAIRLGQERDQISVWDNAGFHEIPTGGTGGITKRMPHDVSGELRDERGRWTAVHEDVDPGRMLADLRYHGERQREDKTPTSTILQAKRRDGVETFGDLQPGDILAEKHNGKIVSYHTVEDADTRHGLKLSWRSPSGGVEGNTFDPGQKLGSADDSTGLHYVGSEPEPRQHAPMTLMFRREYPSVARQADVAFTRTRSLVSPRLQKQLDAVAVKGAYMSDPRTLARFVPNKNKLEINLNRINPDNSRGPMAELSDAYRIDVESRYHPPHNGYGATTAFMTHELGHFLAQNARPESQLGIRLARVAGALQKLSGGDEKAQASIVRSGLSSYATEDFPHEMLAEGWSEYALSDHPRPLARIIGGYLSDTVEGQAEADRTLAQQLRLGTEVAA